jgi:undecaprenyl-diphosphatase
MPFVWYRLVLGVVLIVLVSMGVLSPSAGEPAH